MTVVVHLARHAEVASHRGDVPLTDGGEEQARELGRRVAGWCRPGERVEVLHTASRRAVGTAVAAHATLTDALDGVEVAGPTRQAALRNPDLYVAGHRVDFGSSPQAVADQVPGWPDAGEPLRALGFWREWFDHPDRVGYWVAAPQPRGEDAGAVARRLLAWGVTLRDVPGADRRVLAVSHSPNLRALIRHCFGDDPGEPGFCESVTVRMVEEGSATVAWRGAEVEVAVPV